MKAIVLNEIGKFESLQLQNIPDPRPGEGEVLVKVHASALNHRDIWIIQGRYARIKVPVVLGSDGAGEVIAVGKRGKRDWINRPVVINPALDWGSDPRAQQDGFRILGMPDNGTQAEYIVVPQSSLYQKPEYLTFNEAAAIPLAGLTGYRALFTQGKLRTGQTVLLTGIGGGVSSLMMQMALATDACVLVTSQDDQKIKQAENRGVLAGFNYRDPEWSVKLLSFLADRNVDLVVDSAGGEGFSQLLEIVKPGGRIVILGATAGNPPEINLRRIFWKQITVLGTTMGNNQDFRRMLRFFEVHQLQPLIDSEYGIADYVPAYQRLMQGKQLGKVVLHHKSD